MDKGRKTLWDQHLKILEVRRIFQKRLRAGTLENDHFQQSLRATDVARTMVARALFTLALREFISMSRITPSLAILLVFASFANFAIAKEKEQPKMLRHVVLFKFKAEATEDQITAVTDAFAALPKKIDTIKDFEWGTDVSVEGKAEGFTHCFVVTFADEKGREIYLPHPAHKDFVKIVGPVLDKVLVVDYWAK